MLRIISMKKYIKEIIKVVQKIGSELLFPTSWRMSSPKRVQKVRIREIMMVGREKRN